MERAENQENRSEKVEQLKYLLEENSDRRVVVVGTTCSGKSTFLREIPECRDMDSMVFPQLSPEEADYVCQTPWTPEIGQTMTRLVKERVHIEPGHPVFGTVVIDSDLIIYLKIDDELLRRRTKLRGVNFEDAKNMQQQIDQEISESGVPVITFLIE